MAGGRRSFGQRLWQTLGAVKTGVILLVLVVIFAAAGTLILQRPATDPDELQRAYAPELLRVLDFFKLTDVFHSWWFVALLGLVSLSIVAASIQRFPNAWRFYARPYRSTDETFRRALQVQARIPLCEGSEESGLEAAEQVLRRRGFRPERCVRESSFSLFGERNRFSEMAVFIVHASLLLIFAGGIVDAIWGWRGFVALGQGEQAAKIELRDGTMRKLPFAVRCDAAGQQNYTDGTPKRWWSKLAVIDAGREVVNKEIAVNDPLVYRGVRFYQASYGSTGKLDKLVLAVTKRGGKKEEARQISLGLNETAQLDADTSVVLEEFIPDYVVRDGAVYTRSTQMDNPAVHLIVATKSDGKSVNVWMPPISGFQENDRSPYQFDASDLTLGYFTGLQVSHEPGQWGVWAGVLLMGVGLAVVFYIAHMRIWVVPVLDGNGRMELWIGGTANRNKDAFELRFKELVSEIEMKLKSGQAPAVPSSAVSVAG